MTINLATPKLFVLVRLAGSPRERIFWVSGWSSPSSSPWTSRRSPSWCDQGCQGSRHHGWDGSRRNGRWVGGRRREDVGAVLAGRGRVKPARVREVVDPGAVGGTIHLSAPPEQRSTYWLEIDKRRQTRSYLWRCWERERGARVAWRKVYWVGEKMKTGRIHGIGLLMIFYWGNSSLFDPPVFKAGGRYCNGHKTRQVLITVTAIWGRVRLNRSANGDLVDFFKNAGTFPVMRCKCITIARISLHFSETGDIYTQLVMNTLRPQHCRNIAIKKVVWKTQFLHFFVRHPENEVAQSIPASCFRKNGCFHKDAVILIRGYLCALSAYPAQSSV